MSHEVVITRRQMILLFFANPGRAGFRSTVVFSSFTTVLLRSALPGYAKTNKLLFHNNLSDCHYGDEINYLLNAFR
jgi:hypothetical protein